MAEDQNRNHAPVPTDGGVPTTQAPAQLPAQLDANGFDPTEFEWRPVPRRPRRDGWTHEVQQRFIEALARTGVVERACEAVNMSVTSAYNLRNSPGGEGFRRAWHDVLARAADRVLDIAFEHAIEGEEVPIFDRDGMRVGSKRRYNTRMAMFILRAYYPQRFRHAHKDMRAPEEPALPPAAPVADIVATLAPVTPAEPHLLATPERLDDMIYCAETLAKFDANNPPSDHQRYEHRRIEETHPHVLARSHRNRMLRAEREDRQDEALGLNFSSTSDQDPPRDPLSDYTYWVQHQEAEKSRQAAAEAAEEEDWDDDDFDDDGDAFDGEDDEDDDDEESFDEADEENDSTST